MKDDHMKGLHTLFDDVLATREDCLLLGYATPTEVPPFLHFHKQLEIGLCLSGRGVFYIHGEVYPYGPGDISLIYPGESHIAQSARGAAGEWMFLTVDTERLFSGMRDEERLQALASRPLGTGHVLTAEENLCVKPFVKRFITLYEDGCETHAKKAEQYTALLSCFLYESALWQGRAAVTAAVACPLYTERLQDIYPAIEHILNSYTEDVRIEDLCRCCRMSPVHLRRLFSSLLGLSPIAFLHKIRIGYACGALADPALSILAVAGQCGYASLSSFNRQFHKWMQCSPSSYRSSVLQNGENGRNCTQ